MLQLQLWPGMPSGRCPLCRSRRPAPATCAKCVLRLVRVTTPVLSWAEERALLRRELVRLSAERTAAERAHTERLHRLGELRDANGHRRPVRVALVGCGAAKQAGRHKARDLYTGALTRAALAHAERTADETLILSALHGLVGLDEELDAYDLRLDSYRKTEREQWAYRVLCALAQRFRGLEIELTIYASATYADGVERALLMYRQRPRRSTDPAFVGFHVRACHTPLAGLTLGRRLPWFKAHQCADAQMQKRVARCRGCRKPHVIVAGARCLTCVARADERAAARAARLAARAAKRQARAERRATERAAREERRKTEAAARRTRQITKQLRRDDERRRSDESSRRAMGNEAAAQRQRAAGGQPVGVPVHCGGWVAADGVLYSAAEYGAKEDRAMALRMGWARPSANDGATVTTEG